MCVCYGFSIRLTYNITIFKMNAIVWLWTQRIWSHFTYSKNNCCIKSWTFFFQKIYKMWNHLLILAFYLSIKFNPICGFANTFWGHFYNNCRFQRNIQNKDDVWVHEPACHSENFLCINIPELRTSIWTINLVSLRTNNKIVLSLSPFQPFS